MDDAMTVIAHSIADVFLNVFFIVITRLSAKGTNGVMKKVLSLK